MPNHKNKPNCLRSFFFYIHCSLVLLFAVSVAAEVEVTTKVEKRVLVVSASPDNPLSEFDDRAEAFVQQAERWREVENVNAGDILRYTLLVRNTGSYTVPRGHLVVEDEVPLGTSLLTKRLQWQSQSNLSVSVFGAEFVSQSLALASPAQWRFMRWEYMQPLDPGEGFDLTFFARVDTKERTEI